MMVTVTAGIEPPFPREEFWKCDRFYPRSMKGIPCLRGKRGVRGRIHRFAHECADRTDRKNSRGLHLQEQARSPKPAKYFENVGARGQSTEAVIWGVCPETRHLSPVEWSLFGQARMNADPPGNPAGQSSHERDSGRQTATELCVRGVARERSGAPQIRHEERCLGPL